MKSLKIVEIFFVLVFVFFVIYMLVLGTSPKKDVCPPNFPQDKVHLFQSIFYEDSANEFDTEFYGAIADFAAISGVGTCRDGSQEGENINHKYCSLGYNTKKTISEKGIVQPTKRYGINLVADKNTCEIVGKASSTLRNKVECDIISISCKEI